MNTNSYEYELLNELNMNATKNLNSNRSSEENQNRSNSAHSNLGSAHTERSLSPHIHNKTLPPVVKRPSENVPPPDPKPFLQSAASTLHTRTKKDILQRRTLISLPPIKPFEMSQLAVESPHKMMSHNGSTLVNGQSNEQKKG